MERDALLTLSGLVAVALIAGGCVWLLLGVGRQQGRRAEPVVGYPPDRFPQREVVGLAPLVALATSQRRLLSVYGQLPPRSEAAVWMQAYLGELRAIMDTAYRAAGIAAVYGDTSLLERVAAEVAESERAIAQEAIRHVLYKGDDFDEAALDGRLAVLRRYSQELAR